MHQTQSLLSLILTIYNGSKMLDNTLARLSVLKKEMSDICMEIIAIDDGSIDDSFDKILAYRNNHPEDNIHAIKLSRNYGAMAALQAGIDHAKGDCITVLPQDLQDPPEAIKTMFYSWQNEGIKAHFTIRTKDREEAFIKKNIATLYHFLFRHIAMPNYPNSGLAIFLIDRQIVDILCQNKIRHADILTYTFSLGYSCKLHPFPRFAPKEKSRWTVAKNIKLAIDNFIAFSYFPVRLMSLVGFIVAIFGFSFSVYVFIGKITDWYIINQPPGWATLVVLTSVFSGLLMIMLGVIGEYLWRILDYVCNKPIYLIDQKTNDISNDKTSINPKI